YIHTPPYAHTFIFFNTPPTTDTYTLSLHDALPICCRRQCSTQRQGDGERRMAPRFRQGRQRSGQDDRHHRRREQHRQCERGTDRSEEHTSELQSRSDLVCRLLLEKKNFTSVALVYT